MATGADVKVLPNHVGSCVSEMQLVVRLALVVVVCLFVCLFVSCLAVSKEKFADIDKESA